MEVCYFELLTTYLFVTAVHSAVHQHLTFPSTLHWPWSGTDEWLTLNTHSVIITNAFLAAALPSLTKLFELWNRVNAVTATNVL